MTDDERPSITAMMTDRLGRLGIRSGQILLVVILVSALVYGLVQLKLVVIPLLIALILAAALSPAVNWLRRRGLPAVLATWITLLAGIIILGGVITLMVLTVQNQWAALAKAAGDGLQQLQDYLVQANIPIDEQQIKQVQQSIGDFITSTQFGTGALAGLSIATQLITGILLTVVILFFFLKDGGDIWAFFLRPFHGAGRERGVRIGHTSLAVLGGYVRGTAIVALADAVVIGGSLFFLQIPLALPLTVFVFLSAFIPLIGATLAGVLAALVALVTGGPLTALIVVGIVVVVNQLEGDFLQPIVMSQSLKLHPLVILVALTAGTILGGIAGAVLAVPIAAVSWAIVKAWNVPDDGL
ncbi:AI-2E family transporter [Cryobacterium tepidiphilum]|uniref:AI-2E family transporter n=1 Tax=Cryobacterium tepidiphilum TaxID=2486026 RepID=A0A3M8LER3_9MICO|nr:AI-2E family transporter [Cryobacterium tepidiphilum]RNE63940.1 AI-2E family transporter [Cryobacterium tepidiphilum]